jgi:hypothetical protein
MDQIFQEEGCHIYNQKKGRKSKTLLLVASEKIREAA